MDAGGSMLTAFDYVWARLEGLTDDEYLGEPVPGAWTATAAAGRRRARSR